MTTKTILPDLVVRGAVIAHDGTTYPSDNERRPCVKLHADHLLDDDVLRLRNWLNDYLGHHTK